MEMRRLLFMLVFSCRVSFIFGKLDDSLNQGESDFLGHNKVEDDQSKGEINSLDVEESSIQQETKLYSEEEYFRQENSMASQEDRTQNLDEESISNTMPHLDKYSSEQNVAENEEGPVRHDEEDEFDEDFELLLSEIFSEAKGIEDEDIKAVDDDTNEAEVQDEYDVPSEDERDPDVSDDAVLEHNPDVPSKPNEHEVKSSESEPTDDPDDYDYDLEGEVDQENNTLDAQNKVDLTIAEHLRKDPDILQSFKPSALKHLVENPKSLSILPRAVLDKIINDPIFSIELPPESLKKITGLLMKMFHHEEEEDGAEEDDYEYHDYDIDYGDDVDDQVNTFIGDLDPEFLKGIDPDLIVDYFENASPEDLKTILNNSTIILSLPAETIGSLLGKLNQDLLIKLLKSNAVSDLYNSTAVNLSKAEKDRINKWQSDVAHHIVSQVDANVLTELPEFIVRGQLTNMQALTTLLSLPEKLQALVNKYGNLLDEIPPHTVVEIVRQDASALARIPTNIFTKLGTCEVVSELSEEFSASQLIHNTTDKFVTLLIKNPDVINCISDLHLSDFMKKTFQDALELDKGGSDETLNSLTKTILSLDDQSIVRLASKNGILEEMPDSVLVTIINHKPNIVSLLPKRTILVMAKLKPWLIGKFSLSSVMAFVERNDVFMALEDRDISNLLAFQPGILSVFATLPTDVMVMFLEKHLDVLDSLPPSAITVLKRVLQNKDLIRAIPTDLHAKLAKKKAVQHLLDKYTLLDILEAHPYLIARVDMSETKPYLKFLQDSWFRERIPCPTIRIAAKDPKLLVSLPNDLLAKVITCRHVLSCIDRKDLEYMMAVSDLGSRLTLSTLMITARNLRLSQVSLRLALNFLTNQVPQSNPTLFFN